MKAGNRDGDNAPMAYIALVTESVNTGTTNAEADEVEASDAE